MSDDSRTYRVTDIMLSPAPFVRPNDTIGTVARTITEHRVPGVPVVTVEGEIIGIITEGDLTEREAEVTFPTFFAYFDAIVAVDAGADFSDEMRKVLATTAEELMSSPVYNILGSATVQELATLMIQENVNPVPVVTEELELIGLATRTNLVQLIARLEAAGVSVEIEPSPLPGGGAEPWA